MIGTSFAHQRRRIPRWATRLGKWAFVFFLIKGLLWLLLPVLALWELL